MKRVAVFWDGSEYGGVNGCFCALAPSTAVFTAERFFHVDAGNFTYSPAVLYANPGDRVTIELASTDVVHGLYVDGYDLNVIADPGQPATLSFIADRPGTFRLRCSVTCGALHPFMTGKIQVGPNLLFWRGIGLALLAFLGVLVCQAFPNRSPITDPRSLTP